MDKGAFDEVARRLRATESEISDRGRDYLGDPAASDAFMAFDNALASLEPTVYYQPTSTLMWKAADGVLRRELITRFSKDPGTIPSTPDMAAYHELSWDLLKTARVMPPVKKPWLGPNPELSRPWLVGKKLLDYQADAIKRGTLPEDQPGGWKLCDEMDMGKIFVLVGLIVEHRKDNAGPTLVVVPPAVVKRLETTFKTDLAPGTLKVLVYYGKTSMKPNSHEFFQPLDIQEYDVIITTYETLRGEFTQHINFVHWALTQDAEEPWETGDEVEDEVEDDNDAEGTMSGFARGHCPLYNIKYLRVVADEAHKVRNKNKAQQALLYVARLWSVFCSGAPFQNTYQSELQYYSYPKIKMLPDADVANMKRSVGELHVVVKGV